MISEQEALDRLRYEVEPLEHLSSDEVADVLRRHEIKGEASMPCRCPVALYLADRVGYGYRVSVSAKFCTLMGTDWTPIRLPDGVRSFIERFDDGDYADLRIGELEW